MPMNTPITTTTDGTRGQPLAARVLARKDELEDLLAELGPPDAVLRREVETALATVCALVTGDIARPPDVVARGLSRWLERHNKHLGQDITLASRRGRAR